MNLVNLQGLIRLVNGCTKPTAQPFKAWVSDVIATIQRAGSYSLEPAPVPALTGAAPGTRCLNRSLTPLSDSKSETCRQTRGWWHSRRSTTTCCGRSAAACRTSQTLPIHLWLPMGAGDVDPVGVGSWWEAATTQERRDFVELFVRRVTVTKATGAGRSTPVEKRATAEFVRPEQAEGDDAETGESRQQEMLVEAV